MSRTEEAPWTIQKSGIGNGWWVRHPRAHAHRVRTSTWFPTHAEALAFVLAQPEVRRRTSKPAQPHGADCCEVDA